jgi:hypothetical protein
MTSERIKQIQQGTPYPESISVMLALKQVWNECEQERMYSEDEVLQLLLRLKLTESYDNLYDWFQIFKKK